MSEIIKLKAFIKISKNHYSFKIKSMDNEILENYSISYFSDSIIKMKHLIKSNKIIVYLDKNNMENDYNFNKHLVNMLNDYDIINFPKEVIYRFK